MKYYRRQQAVNGIICLHSYPEIIKVFSVVCAALIAILAIVITALVIPRDVFIIGELWGIVFHRYQVIVCSGLVTCFPAYFLAKHLWCRRCTGSSEKTEERYAQI